MFFRSKKTRPLLFVHIPKTAGTSFRVGAEKQFGASRVCRDYGSDARATAEVVRSLVYAKPDFWAFREALQSRGCRFLTGHFQAARYVPLFGVDSAITFLREPTARVFSEYRHACELHSFQGTFADFFRKPENVNRQTRILSGVPWAAMGFVGITEMYKESVMLFNSEYSARIPYLKKNQSTSSVSWDSSTAKELLELNWRDEKLYLEAVEQLKWRLRLNSCGQSYVHGEFEVKGDGTVLGWAFSRNSLEAVTVEILVDGQQAGILTATEFSTDLRQVNAPRGGYVGFSTKVDSYTKGQSVCVAVPGTGQLLARKI